MYTAQSVDSSGFVFLTNSHLLFKQEFGMDGAETTLQSKIKYDEMQIKFRNMYWLMNRRSELSISNKLKIYKQILRPAWSYGIQLWRCAKKSNNDILQRFQNKVRSPKSCRRERINIG